MLAPSPPDLEPSVAKTCQSAHAPFFKAAYTSAKLPSSAGPAETGAGGKKVVTLKSSIQSLWGIW